jgi:hypothetical protein
MMESIILHILIMYGAFQNFWKGKVHLHPPNNSLCSFNPLNKILAQFTPPNNSSRCNIPPIKICLLFLGTQVEFEAPIFLEKLGANERSLQRD